MSKQSIKETMQQSLDMLEKGGLNCEQEEFVAQSLCQAIADCEQAEKQEPIAWKHCDDERVIANATKQGAIADGGAIAATTKNYSIPAYTHPSNVRRLSDCEIVSINSKSVSIFSKAYAIMDACNIPK